MSSTNSAQETNTTIDSNDIESQVINIVAKRLEGKISNPNKISRDSSLTEDLGADSLDTVELIMSVEEKFEIEISEEDAQKMSTIGDVVQYVKTKLEQQ